ncbi:uncharacterized protein L201_005918 [Kwoniella dendrophila CBS 6074]|uniref:F-box domain-containing protein n=1 Tax=Kwoniella dendrophila CBS 6074 TaxID=1295534 RepID=A0AAX4K1C9_9TREE
MSQAAIERISGCPINHTNNASSSTSTTPSSSTIMTTPPPTASTSEMIASSSSTRNARSKSPVSTPLTPISDSEQDPISEHIIHNSAPITRSSCFALPINPQLQSPLLRAPVEIIQKILIVSGGEDVQTIARAAKVCRELRSIIYENPDQALWRQIHLQHYDDPRLAGAFTKARSLGEIDWKRRIQDREFVRRIFHEWSHNKVEQVNQHIGLISSTLMDVYLDLPPTSESYDPSTSSDSLNTEILSNWIRSSLFKHMYESEYFVKPEFGTPTAYKEKLRGNQKRKRRNMIDPIISRLHCLIRSEYNDESSEDREWRGFIRESIYNTRNYHKKNDWGPFKEDGKVDWNLLDAISSAMMLNAQAVIDSEPDAWLPAIQPMLYGVEPTRSLGFNNLTRPANLAEGEIWDWADVEGTWCGCYAFMDYADWVGLNQPLLMARSGTEIDLSTYHEALGDLMKLELKICKDPFALGGRQSTSCPNHEFEESDRHPLPPMKSGLPSSDLLQPIYFHGSSAPYPGDGPDTTQQAPTLPQNAIRGVVRLTADNPPQVKWTLIIRYRGQDRWRLECVQVGGRGSKRGFFGIWSDAARSEHSPCGPAWYWKT